MTRNSIPHEGALLLLGCRVKDREPTNWIIAKDIAYTMGEVPAMLLH